MVIPSFIVTSLRWNDQFRISRLLYSTNDLSIYRGKLIPGFPCADRAILKQPYLRLTRLFADTPPDRGGEVLQCAIKLGLTMVLGAPKSWSVTQSAFV